MYVSQTLEKINSELFSQFPNERNHPKSHNYERYTSFKVYSSEDIEQLIIYGKVLSVVLISFERNDPKFSICQHGKVLKQCLIYKVSFLDDNGFDKCGIYYAPIKISLT